MAKEQSIDLKEEMSPEEVHDIQQMIQEKFAEGGDHYCGYDIEWPEITAERLIISGMNYAIPNHKANCIWVKDSDEPIVAAVTSANYKFIPYEVTVHKFLEFLSTYEVWGRPDIKVNIIGTGEKISVSAEFKEHLETLKTNAKVGDTIAPCAGFKHSIDLKWPYSVECGALQLACTNGMVASRLNQAARKKHRAALDIESMNESLIDSMNEFPEQVAVWNHWGGIDINGEQTEELIDASFGPRHKEEILALPEAQSKETLDQWMKEDKVNVFDLYSVMTQFVTHELESEMVKVNRANHVADLLHHEFPLS